MSEFRRGFKSWCENTSKGFRRDLSLAVDQALSPRALASHLGVIVWTPEEVAKLGGLDQVHLDQLLHADSRSWSAVTLVVPTHRVIIENSTHNHVRRNSNIMHEIAHLVLEHEPARVDMTAAKLMILDTYDKTQEAEADWLAGALLVPRDGLLKVASEDPRDEYAAERFDVSVPMLKMRRQRTGIDIQLRRRQAG